jgi:phosphatidylserine decarboxylase
MSSIIAREGYPFITAALFLAIALYALSFVLPASLMAVVRTIAMAALLFSLFCTWFFRDPERSATADSRSLLSPADGTVIDIREVQEPLFLKTTVRRVSIFMSVFSVHVNRAPMKGTLDFVHYNPGKFVSAFKEKASLDNESIFIGIKEPASSRAVAVKLIAGLIARRIVLYKKTRDELQRGERIGMIRFGSRAEIYCPLSTEIRVKKGDAVTAGVTVVGILKE